MRIYIEKQAKNYPQAQKILTRYKKADIVYIDHYKNVFDTKNLGEEKASIVAKLTSPAITKAPSGYGHTMSAFFIKTGLNCVFNCSYCYLKGLFKNEHMVVFVNYDDIQKQIRATVEALEGSHHPEHRFYSGDYSDIIGLDPMTDFVASFVPFFETLNQATKANFMMEIRTKSAHISSLLALNFVPNYTEVSFSLNPQELIARYEQGTASLDARITAINSLLEKGFKVGLRFLPILPVKNWESLYTAFMEKIKKEIDITKIHSSFASGLLYTKKDYNTMLKKYPELDILYMLELENDDFYREAKTFRDKVYAMFKELDKGCIFCLEN